MMFGLLVVKQSYKFYIEFYITCIVDTTGKIAWYNVTLVLSKTDAMVTSGELNPLQLFWLPKCFLEMLININIIKYK